MTVYWLAMGGLCGLCAMSAVAAGEDAEEGLDVGVGTVLQPTQRVDVDAALRLRWR
jgi:hypothetical protein